MRQYLQDKGFLLRHVDKAMLVATAIFIMLLALPVCNAVAFEHFISRDGSNLFDGKKPYRFVSVNIPNYFILEDRAGTHGKKWHRVSEFEQRDAASAVKRLGGQVFRSYTFAVAGGKNLSDNLAHIYADKSGRIRYNEELFRDVDRGLAIAAAEGVRVIIPLVDNWAWFGGFAEWAALSGTQDFWNDLKARSEFKKFISWLLNRKNTVTGVMYKDDPTIMAWELGNEIDKASSGWISNMAAHIKANDQNHLIVDGGHKHIPEVSLQDENIDIVTTHYTDQEFTAFATQAEKAGKAYFYGEFDPASSAEVGKIVQRTIESGMAGCLVWSLRFRTEFGGFYYHSDFNGASDSLHYPGFSTTKPDGEAEIIRILREGAFAIQGLPVTPEAAPEAPVLLTIESPSAINWQGSSGAIAYDVQRKKDQKGSWQTIATDVSDAIPFNQNGEITARLPLFSDQPGPGLWAYRVTARNDMGASEPSNSMQINVSK
jgi:mannan endo-1,4-beta-mannosidase